MTLENRIEMCIASIARKTGYVHGMGPIGLVLPRSMVNLVGQAAILLGGDGFCQGLFHNITNFLVEISNFRLISHLINH
jgi:hypothetical protein